MLGIVLLNYNSFSDTKKCVESILNTIKTTEYIIYIIDNNSPDQSYNSLKKEYEQMKDIKVIQSGKNGGYSYGNNIGIKKAIEDTCNAILVSNTDIIYFNNSIDSMYSKLFADKNIAVVGPDMINFNEEYSQVNILPPSTKNYWKSKKPFSFMDNQKTKNKYKSDYKFRGMVQGSSFMIKADIIEKTNYLDEEVFLFGEELILAHKLNYLNYDTLIDHNALIKHDHSATISKEGQAFERYHMYYSTAYVLRKYLKISNFSLTNIVLYNVLFYGLQTVLNKSYRSMYISFVKKMISLYEI